MTSIKDTLQFLFQQQTLKKIEAKSILMQIAKGDVPSEQIAAFLTVFNVRRATLDEILGFRECLQELALPVQFSGETMDMCGTGGDGKDTFNISTLASFVAAGAGVRVTKHGNYSASSVSGSSHMLEHFGYRFSTETDALNRQLDECGICFLHAPLFNPAMKAVAPARKAMGVKTFLNILGPLVNPGKPTHQLSGVFNLETARYYEYILNDLGKKYTIVHALDGYDEVSLTGATKIIQNEGHRLLEPIDFGFESHSAKAIAGGKSVEDNAKIFLNILKNEGTQAQKNVVVANAALAIQTYKEIPLTEALAQADESLTSGKAYQLFNSLIACSQK